MKNPITRIVYLFFCITLIYGFVSPEVSYKKFELMIYLIGGITVVLVLRAETLGNVFINISEGIKEKWKKWEIKYTTLLCTLSLNLPKGSNLVKGKHNVNFN